MIAMTQDKDLGYLRKMKRNPIAKALRQRDELKNRVERNRTKYRRDKTRNWEDSE